MDTVFVQPPVPPSQRHNQPSTAQPHHIHAQQSLAPPITNNVMFDVDLDEWNASPTALTVDTHCQPITSYPSMAMDAQSTSRPKQGDILFEGVLARYSTPPNTGHHQFFDLTSPIPSPPSADPIGAHPQSCPTGSRQYQSSASNFYAASPSQLSRPPYSQHHQHQHHHHQHQQHQHQHYSTVHPAEISPLDTCPSNSPLSVYHSEMAGCDPGGYLCASDLASPSEGCLKGTLVADIGSSSSMGGGMGVTPSAVQDNWNGDSRKAVQGGGNGGDFGDLDAEGEDVDLSDDVEQPLNGGGGGGGPLSGSSDPLATVVKSDVGAVGENNELLFDDTDESKLSEDSCSASSTDSDGSEFIPGSRPARSQRRPQTTMSLSYPTYGYSGGGTRSSHRTRSGTRYTPYPNGYSTENNGGGYVDEQQQDRSTRRYNNNATTTDHHLGGDDGLSAGDFSDPYLNITTLSTSPTSAAAAAASRRRPRPTNSLPVPIPIPHLTKKSRGRRVPTVTSLEDLRSASSGAGRKRQTVGRGARMYLCEVDGCGKCFARGEHLKRHVRSIHTYEKPHRCPYPGCGKDFSRHDNLGQHMRVHKDYAPSAEA